MYVVTIDNHCEYGITKIECGTHYTRRPTHHGRHCVEEVGKAAQTRIYGPLALLVVRFGVTRKYDNTRRAKSLDDIGRRHFRRQGHQRHRVATQ